MKSMWLHRFAGEEVQPAPVSSTAAPPDVELSPQTPPVSNPPPARGGGRKGRNPSRGSSSAKRDGRPESFQTPPPPQSQQQAVPLFQTPQQQTSPFQLFGQQTAAPLRSSTQPPVSQTPQATAFPSSGQVWQLHLPSQPAPPSSPPPPSQQPLLLTKDMAPAGYSTKFEHLHPESQKLLLQMEKHILEQKHLSEELDQCSLLLGSSLTYDRFVLDSKRVQQELEGMTIAVEREKDSNEDLTDFSREMLITSEAVIQLYMMLRPRFLRLYTCQNTRTAGASRLTRHPNPKRPSMLMKDTVARFETYLSDCLEWTNKAERLLIVDTKKTSSNSLKALPVIVKNAHSYFIHVAAKVENLHQHVESMKRSYHAHHQRY